MRSFVLRCAASTSYASQQLQLFIVPLTINIKRQLLSFCVVCPSARIGGDETCVLIVCSPRSCPRYLSWFLYRLRSLHCTFFCSKIAVLSTMRDQTWICWIIRLIIPLPRLIIPWPRCLFIQGFGSHDLGFVSYRSVLFHSHGAQYSSLVAVAPSQSCRRIPSCMILTSQSAFLLTDFRW
jgi:hypothetical protein